MTPTLALSKIRPNRILSAEESRALTLERLKQWREADEHLHKVCKELGIAVPVMVC